MSVKISTCILLVSLFLGLHPITTSSRCTDSQKSSLWSFKNDLKFDSEPSFKLSTWNLSMDCCEWWGVTCDEAGHLTELSLNDDGITGGITSPHLKSLKLLNLAYNLLSGNFPESLLTSLPSLEALYLFNNKLSGPIRKDIRVASYNLSALDLSNNRLQGPLPEFIFKLPSILTLKLPGNNFTGSVNLDGFGKFKNLYELDLSYNNLTVIANTKKSSSFSSLAKLDTLRLASCKMQKIPNLKNQASLRTLDLSDNRFKGEIPNWIWSVGNGVLDLSSNKLKGDIPVPPSEVIIVDFSNNKFGSSIPADFGNALSFVVSFSISNSKVTGVIPGSINNARFLRFLDLSSNSLAGPIPLDGSTQSLESLDLSVNKLSGRIPEQLTNIMTLEFLNVSYNRLSGKIPQGGARFPTFSKLSFEGNKGLCGPPLSKTC
ncbi:leucine-rich repeat protein [Tanacetum coccineum]|uniref:Leucine-rich repeat protein n=1 Tax=Tanacetum coccineum TaxID=301880 RepID=A0ABQ5F9C8_9ASTR